MYNWLFKILTGAAVVSLLSACGGGSGGCQLPSCGKETATQYSLTLSAIDPATDGPFDNVNGALVFNKPVRLVATLTDKNGVAQAGKVITAAVSNTSIATLSSSGSVLTDSKGQGVLNLSALAPSSAGAVTVTASATIVVGDNTYSAQKDLSFRINETSVVGTVGTPAYLQYVSTSPVRLFVAGGAAGSNNAAEQAVTSFKVLDASSSPVPGATVYFEVTKRNGGILTNGSSARVPVTADSQGVAKVTVTSGTEPISINVIAYLQDPSTTPDATKFFSSDQITISGKKPAQSKFFLLWASDATCGTGAARIYPCNFNAYVGDENGQPVADGTVVNLVSDTGIIVADIQAGQPSGACLTVNSQCSAKYYGKGSVAIGNHHIIAYTVGQDAPLGAPITLDGSWTAPIPDAVGGTVVVSTKDANSDSYVRNCIRDNPTLGSNTCRPF